MNKFITLMLLLTTINAGAGTIISTTSAAQTGSFSFGPGDAIEVETHSIKIADTSIFDGAENIDAIAQYGGGWIISTSTDSTIKGTPYLDGDLILWQPATKTATLWMPESVFGTDEDIDALELTPDGHILISTATDANLGGLAFTAGDIVSYNRTTGTASLWFKGADHFDAVENIDALALLPDATMLFSTATDASIGGWAFRDGDIIRYDGSRFSLWLSESIFAADEDIDALAVTVPEPGSLSLLLIGLGFLLRNTRKHEYVRG